MTSPNRTNHFTTGVLTERLPSPGKRAARRRQLFILASVIAAALTLAGVSFTVHYIQTYRPPAPVIIIATARPIPTIAPTATPAPTAAPEPIELRDGTVLAYDPARGWYVVRDGQTAAAAPTAEPGPREAIYQVSAEQPAAGTTHERETAPDDTGPAATEAPPIYDLRSAREFTGVPLVLADPCAAWRPPLALPAGCVPGGDGDQP